MGEIALPLVCKRNKTQLHFLPESDVAGCLRCLGQAHLHVVDFALGAMEKDLQRRLLERPKRLGNSLGVLHVRHLVHLAFLVGTTIMLLGHSRCTQVA